MLTLREIVQATGGEVRGGEAQQTTAREGADNNDDVRFSRVVIDSRQVAPGALFVALRGQKHDAHAFVAQALASGAAGALVDHVPADCAWALDPPAAADSANPADRRSADDPADMAKPDNSADLPVRSNPDGAADAVDQSDQRDAPNPGSWRGAASGPPLIVVGSTVTALADMARFALDRHPKLDVVGITGSLGKTTTKEVVAGVLGARRSVLKSEGNLNSEIGLPMTVLNGLDRPHEIAVLEMAMYSVGRHSPAGRLARPRIGVVDGGAARAPRAHGYHRRDPAGEAGAGRGASGRRGRRGGVLNVDDPRVAQMARATRCPSGALRCLGGCRRARGTHPEPWSARRRIRSAARGQRRHVHLPLLGAHSVHAALAATAVALEEGFSLSEVAEALHELSPTLRLLVVDGHQWRADSRR